MDPAKPQWDGCCGGERERESRVALPSMQENLSNKCEKNELEWLFFFCNVPSGVRTMIG